MSFQGLIDLIETTTPIEQEQESYLGKIIPLEPSSVGVGVDVGYFLDQDEPLDLIEKIKEGYFVGSSPERAIRFLKAEAECWIGKRNPGTSWEEDPEFWDAPGKEVVKDGFYARRVYPQFKDILEGKKKDRYNFVLIPQNSREGGPCILSIHFERFGDRLYVTEVFRSVEVSKNLINDLFILWFLIREYLIKRGKDINLVIVNLMMVNPHILI